MTLETIMRDAWADVWLRIVVGLLFLNLITGVADAMTHKTFSLDSLGDFMLSRALPFVLVDAALQVVFRFVFGGVDLGMLGLSALAGDAVHLVVISTLAAKILANLRDMRLIGDVPRAVAGPRKPKTTATP